MIQKYYNDILPLKILNKTENDKYCENKNSKIKIQKQFLTEADASNSVAV